MMTIMGARRERWSRRGSWALFFPTVVDSARGIKFIEAAVESSARGGIWVDATLPM